MHFLNNLDEFESLWPDLREYEHLFTQTTTALDKIESEWHAIFARIVGVHQPR